MQNSMKLNYFLGGTLVGVLLVNGCSGGERSLFDAWAQDDAPVRVEIVASSSSPLPVMVCDGQEMDGTCAEVNEDSTHNRMRVYTGN